MSYETLDGAYWNQRYVEERTGWDIGYPSTPLKEYIDQLEDKSIRILIPGAGNAYEAEYLWSQGFVNTTIVDIAPEVTSQFAKRNPDFPEEQIMTQDFFHVDGKYDLILEQTFHCALPPAMRDDYVSKLFELLDDGGRYVGVLFKHPLTKKGPPFGGSKEEYAKRFGTLFQIQVLEDCYNSIRPRAGEEYFINLLKTP